MALILNGTTGITVTDGSNILQDGTVQTADLANAAVTSAKMATGAAATNLGNYVQSFNGSTGAVTGVSTVNGSTGAVTVQPTLVSGSNIKTINSTSLLGSGDIAISSTPTTEQVLSATAGLTVSSSLAPVGAYMFAINFVQNSTFNFGTTIAGSSLRPAAASSNKQTATQTGTFRVMGWLTSDADTQNSTTLLLRIS